MKRLLAAAGALLCLLSAAHAQLTTITAASIKMGGTPIASGSVSFTPVSSYGIPIPFSTGGGGLNSPQAFSCTITAGAIAAGCQVPDAELTTPANILYAIQVTDSGSGRTFTLQAVPNITGASWALDQYGPSVPTSSSQNLTVSYGTAAITSCATPSLYIRNYQGGQLYICVGGVPVLVNGSSGGSSPVSGMVAPLNVSGAALPSSDLQTISRPAYAAILHALHGAASAPARILVIGDSRSVVDTTVGGSGGGSTLAVTFGNRWVDLLRKYLQGVYGSHGTGMVPLFWGQGVGTVVNQDYYSTSATLSNDCSLGPSVSSSSYCGVAVLPAGSTLNFITSIPYDHLRAYCETLPSSGTLTVAIDGAAAGTLCTGTSSAAAVSIGTSSAVTLAAHTAVLTCAAGGGACPLYATEGVAGTSGVSVDNASVGGAALGAFASSPATQFAFSDAVPEHEQLVIELHHTNEPGIGETTAQFQTELNNIINHERALASPPSIELVALAQDNDNVAGQAPFYPIIASTAAASNTGFVDVRNRTGSAFDSTLFGPDGIHENNTGAANNYAMISAPFIDMPTPPGASSGGVSGTADITSGSIDGTSIGQSVPAAGNFAGLGLRTVNSSNFTGITYRLSGLNNFDISCWGATNGAGLAGSCGVFDETTSTFPWVVNGTDDVYFGVPIGSGNVGAGTGATSAHLHDGTILFPQLKATTGTRFVCVDTTGKLVSQTTACSGT